MNCAQTTPHTNRVFSVSYKVFSKFPNFLDRVWLELIEQIQHRSLRLQRVAQARLKPPIGRCSVILVKVVESCATRTSSCTTYTDPERHFVFMNWLPLKLSFTSTRFLFLKLWNQKIQLVVICPRLQLALAAIPRTRASTPYTGRRIIFRDWRRTGPSLRRQKLILASTWYKTSSVEVRVRIWKRF